MQTREQMGSKSRQTVVTKIKSYGRGQRLVEITYGRLGRAPFSLLHVSRLICGAGRRSSNLHGYSLLAQAARSRKLYA